MDKTDRNENVISIPAKRRLFAPHETTPQMQQVTLPLQASISFKQALTAIVLLCFAGLVGFVIYIFAADPSKIFANKSTGAWHYIGEGWAVIVLTMACYGAIFTSAAFVLTMIRLCQSGPILTLHSDGFYDLRRSPEIIPWSNVAFYTEASGGKGGTIGLRLYLKEPAPFKPPRFQRLLLLLIGIRAKPRATIVIPLRGLTEPFYVIQQSMIQLIEKNGGQRKTFLN